MPDINGIDTPKRPRVEKDITGARPTAKVRAFVKANSIRPSLRNHADTGLGGVLAGPLIEWRGHLRHVFDRGLQADGKGMGTPATLGDAIAT